MIKGTQLKLLFFSQSINSDYAKNKKAELARLHEAIKAVRDKRRTVDVSAIQLSISFERDEKIYRKRRDEILNQLATDREYREACDKISGLSQLSDELFQEMCEIMCRLEDERLIGLYERGELKWFVVSVLSKMWRYPSSPFYQKHRKPLKDKIEWDSELLDDKWDEYDLSADAEAAYKMGVINETLEELRNSEEKKDHYHANLFDVYMKSGSLRKAERATKIPHESIGRSVRRTKMIITEKIKLSPPNKDE